MDYPVNDLIQDMNFSDYQFQTLKNGLMLMNWEISVLDQYHVPYQKCHSLKEILFEIETIISTLDNYEELDLVSNSISERDYYKNTNF